MAIFDLNDFNYRKVIKLAPDAFITINGAFGGRVISPINKDAAQTIDIQGGVVSINVSSAVNPPGSGRANIQIVAPEYTGFHTRSTSNSSGYWITLPSGAKVPYFLPMMEVQVFMKGRFLYSANTTNPPNPVYYRTFWGFITEITEDYNAGLTTLSIQCSDMLAWWRYQKLSIAPNQFVPIYTEGNIASPTGYFPTIFKKRNPWQIITQLLYETQWLSPDGKATYNMIFPKISNQAQKPYIGDIPDKAIGVLALEMSKYWQNRFNFFGESMSVEMFGLTKQIDDKAIDNIRSTITQNVEIGTKEYNLLMDPDISLDYNLLARVQPFGDFSLYGMGAESGELTKLEIAQKVCDQTQMEFYVDLNGIVVFKPPFYNLDVTKGDIPYYIIDSKDVINYSSSINTDHICTYLELTAPPYQPIPDKVQIIGFHIDWEMMLRYGLRYQKGWCQYGNDAKSLSLLAAAELTKINAEATTGHVSIPMRPEIRMGYPAYIVHKDVYFYITGISHSFSFGAAATTDLTLTAKRERMYDYTGDLTKNAPMLAGGSITLSTPSSKDFSAYPTGSGVGRVLRGFVQKFKKFSGVDSNKTETLKNNLKANVDAIDVKDYATRNAKFQIGFDDPGYLKSSNEKEDFLRITQAKSGPKSGGVYELVPAELTSPLSATSTNGSISNATGPQSTIMSNQLLMITTDTIPYTDIRGYRHIGAFPYGANIVMRNNSWKSINGSTKEVSDEVTAAMTKDPKKDNQAPAALSSPSKYTANIGKVGFTEAPPSSTMTSNTYGITENIIADKVGSKKQASMFPLSSANGR